MLRVEGISCASCVGRIERGVARFPGKILHQTPLSPFGMPRSPRARSCHAVPTGRGRPTIILHADHYNEIQTNEVQRTPSKGACSPPCTSSTAHQAPPSSPPISPARHQMQAKYARPPHAPASPPPAPSAGSLGFGFGSCVGQRGVVCGGMRVVGKDGHGHSPELLGGGASGDGVVRTICWRGL